VPFTRRVYRGAMTGPDDSTRDLTEHLDADAGTAVPPEDGTVDDGVSEGDAGLASEVNPAMDTPFVDAAGADVPASAIPDAAGLASGDVDPDDIAHRGS
jgi:hypothetical protein